MKKILVCLFALFAMNSSQASLQEILDFGEVGTSCMSDYECNSLCCNSSIGACSPHDEVNRCNKTPGQRCVDSDFCKSEYVTQCKIVKISMNPDGTQGCAMRCFTKAVTGDCINSYCVPAKTPPIPEWDGVDCSNAVDP